MSAIKHRHLGRTSSHRQALLRNLVTSLIDLESIATTWPKAKEAQRMAEKLITLGKRNTPAAKSKAESYLYVRALRHNTSMLSSLLYIRDVVLMVKQNPHLYIPKTFGSLRERYAERPGGYTRVLRIEPKKDDQAPSAILELVDGPKDMRFAMTARTLMKLREEDKSLNEITSLNVHKVTRFRKGGEEELEKEVRRLERLKLREQKDGKEKEEGEEQEVVEEDEDEWVDEEVVKRIEVPQSLLKRRKNESARTMPTMTVKEKGKNKSALSKDLNQRGRRKMATEEETT